MTAPDPVTATPAALAELASLRERHGPLMLVQSGGCCDGSSPLCLPRGELFVGPGDLLLGDVDGTPFYVDEELYRRWRRPAFVLDLADGSGDAFSLEAGDGLHFVSRTAACEPASTQGKEVDMSDPAQGIRDAAALLEAGDEAGALRALHAALGAGEDPALRREIHELAARAHESSHGFHKIEWQRLMVDTEPHSAAV